MAQITQNSQIPLDLKDRKILYQLDINSRQSNAQIAKKIGLSKDVVNYRIKQLETNEFIKGYYSIIDLYRLGYISFRIYIKLVNASHEKEKEISHFLINNKKVMYLGKIDGSYDLGIGTYVKSIYEFEEFYSDFKNRYKEYIGKEEISIFTKAYHFHRAYLLDKKHDELNPELIGGENKVECDKKDIEILKLIAANSRISTIEIAEKLKMPATTIAFRIKQLEKKKVIQAHRFIFDFEKYGYDYYKIDLTLNNTSRIKDLINYCHLHPNIIYIDQTIGGSDFEFDIEVKNKAQFLEIMDELKRKFPEIREWSYFTVRNYDKLLYFPDN